MRQNLKTFDCYLPTHFVRFKVARMISKKKKNNVHAVDLLRLNTLKRYQNNSRYNDHSRPFYLDVHPPPNPGELKLLTTIHGRLNRY